MLFSTLLRTLVVLISPTEAFPSISSAKRGFTVVQKATGRYKLRSGPAAVASAYKKFGKSVPLEIQEATRTVLQSGSVPAIPEAKDAEYLSPVQLGSNSQTLMMDFDTGSSELWVFSTQQPKDQILGHTAYDPSVSGIEYKGENWGITYGDGSAASGNIFYDKVVIGGVTATHQAVEAATSVSSFIKNDINSDGIVGLGFDEGNRAVPNKVKTFMTNVMSTLPQPVFASCLKHAAPGSWDFGFLDNAKYTGSISYKTVATEGGFWHFTLEGYLVGQSKIFESLDAIVDSGSALMLLPSSVCSAYYGKVVGAYYESSIGGWIFPCQFSLPDFSIIINGAPQTVPASYMNYDVVHDSGFCFGGLQSSDGLDFSVLGDIFIKGRYVVFDYGNKRVGFAPQS